MRLLLLVLGSQFWWLGMAQSDSLVTKIVYSELSHKDHENQVIFEPFNATSLEFDESRGRYHSEYLLRQNIHWNMYTYLFFQIMAGQLDFYAVNDSIYPFNASHFNDNIQPGINFKFLRQVEPYGFFCYENSIQNVGNENNDSVDLNDAINIYPAQFIYYKDTDIKRYRLKEKWVYNSAGEVVEKSIIAVAPIAQLIPESYDTKLNDLSKPKLLFWVKYEDLWPLLQKHWLILSPVKPEHAISYAKIFQNRTFVQEVLSNGTN
ncbi:MAG: hypothetical protein ACWA41_06710 [Putridiphycobacter sp.]